MPPTRLIPPPSQSTTRHPSRGTTSHSPAPRSRRGATASTLIYLFEYHVLSGDHERDLLLCSIEIITPNGWWSMPPEPVPADPGWDEDLAWLDRDPERECWLDRAREHDDPPEPEESGGFPVLTPDEVAEIEDAAADELLAVEAAAPARPAPGQPGSARA